MPAWRPDALLLGPGGIRGFVELGALLCLESVGFLSEVSEIMGISIGAFIGLLWLCDYKAIDIIQECIYLSLLNGNTSLLDTNIVSEVSRIVEESWGIFGNQKLEDHLNRLVSRRWGTIPTLLELYKSTNKKLTCVSVNFDTGQVEDLNYINNPDLSCVKAALMSGSIPGILEKLNYNNCTYIDGALRDPYPINRFPKERRVLGIYVSSEQFPATVRPGEPRLVAMLRFALQAYSSPVNELHKRSMLAASPSCRHLVLPQVTVDTTGITVSYETKISMIGAGYHSTKQFLKRVVE